MKTQIKKQGDTLIVSMNGKIDYETCMPLRDDLNRLIKPKKTDSTPKKIIFDLKHLDFVGSSHISTFVQTLKEFNSNSPTRPRYSHVKNEFKRIIRALGDQGADQENGEELGPDKFDFIEN